jgi:hypothetical protein
MLQIDAGQVRLFALAAQAIDPAQVFGDDFLNGLLSRLRGMRTLLVLACFRSSAIKCVAVKSAPSRLVLLRIAPLRLAP